MILDYKGIVFSLLFAVKFEWMRLRLITNWKNKSRFNLFLSSEKIFKVKPGIGSSCTFIAFRLKVSLFRLFSDRSFGDNPGKHEVSNLQLAGNPMVGLFMAFSVRRCWRPT